MITTHTIHRQLLDNIANAIADAKLIADAHEKAEEALEDAILLAYDHGLTPGDIDRSLEDIDEVIIDYSLPSKLITLHKPKARKAWRDKQQQQTVTE